MKGKKYYCIWCDKIEAIFKGFLNGESYLKCTKCGNYSAVTKNSIRRV